MFTLKIKRQVFLTKKKKRCMTVLLKKSNNKTVYFKTINFFILKIKTSICDQKNKI